MAIPEQVLGHGTTLEVDRGAGYTTIAHLREIGEVRYERDDVEVTNHQSTAGFKEFRPGLIDPGSLDFSGVWVADTTQVALVTDVLGGVAQDVIYTYRITLPRGLGQFTCDGYLKAVGVNPNREGEIAFSGNLRWTSQATFSITQSAGLTGLTTSNSGVITPAFAQATTDYVITYLTGVASVTVTPTAAAGVITVNGTVVASGSPSGAIALGAAGSLTIVTVRVTETGKVPKEYTLRLLRA